MRHAEGKPSGWVRNPSPTLLPLPRGWGVAPSVRSTPTLWGICAAKRPQGHAQKIYSCSSL
ncbi:MAG: hypothetical protein NZ455_15605 [Bacteroidia bacterium]|nr:hypothetical protein [Bacteroidia bacterium]MDW8347981.1 hypothetical protein [Bacteroidia bacterium]